MPFRIGLQERNDWVECMRGALADAGVPIDAQAAMMRYFEHTATFLMNAPD